MRYLRPDVRANFVKGMVDGRLVSYLWWLDSMVKEYSKSLHPPVEEIIIAEAARKIIRQEELNTLNGRGQGFKTKHCLIGGICGATDIQTNDWPEGLVSIVRMKTRKTFPCIEIFVNTDRMVIHCQVNDINYHKEYSWIAKPIIHHLDHHDLNSLKSVKSKEDTIPESSKVS